MKKSKEGASQTRLYEYTKTKRGCRVKKVLISAIVSIISFIIFVIIFYNVFIYFFPHVTEDGRRYMPISQILKSVLVSFIFSIISFIFCIKKLKTKRQQWKFSKKHKPEKPLKHDDTSLFIRNYIILHFFAIYLFHYQEKKNYPIMAVIRHCGC